MRGTRTDRSNKYTPVPQAVSDEDEGVYEESPESSQQAELISTECISADANSVVFTDDFHNQDGLQTLDFSSRVSHQDTLQPLSFIETESHNKNSKMSFSRQICFLLSISVCMAYMVALLWLIPCHMAPCIVKNNHRTLPLQLNEWSDTFSSLRFVSKPQLVKLPESKTIILVAFQLMDHNTSTLDKKTKEVVGGVIALRGEDGKEAWKYPFYTDVLDVICHTDVNNDGIVDCAVLGSTGLLATVNASNGHTFWYLHDHDDQSAQINAISSPCTLTDMDFDRDGVDDFVIIGIVTYDGFRNVAEATPIPSWQTYDEQVVHVGLLLVSGSNGQIIGQPLPLPDKLAPGSSIGYRKIPNLVVYNLGNNSKSLLLLLGSGDGSHINQLNNPETVLMISMEDLYTGATKDRKADVPYNVYRNVYSATGNIQSISVMENESRAGDVLLLTNNNEELICLDGTNDLQMKWKYHKDKSKISQQILGNFNNDGTLDVFIIIVPVNCSSSCDCKSEIIVLNGKDGQEIMHKSTESMAFNPIVLHTNTPNAADRFLFKSVILPNKNKAQEAKQTEEKPASSEIDKSNKNQSVVLLSGYTNESEQEIWSDIRNYGINEEFKSKPLRISDNDYYLKKVEKLFDQELSTEKSPYSDANSPTSAGTADKNLDPLGKDKSTTADHDPKPPVVILKVLLTEIQKEKGFSSWDVDLYPISRCQELNVEDYKDIVIEDPKFDVAYLLITEEIKGTSKINLISLNTKVLPSPCNKTASAMLHPTLE